MDRDYTTQIDETLFENGDFVGECLSEFDKNVEDIEAEYAITGKSA